MIQRNAQEKLTRLLGEFPAVALLGPRQVGKTTLALDVAEGSSAVYLDLESPRDLAKISDIELFCELHEDRLVIFDEIQRSPEIFAPLRSVIDKRRRQGKKTGQFLLLGSASLDLLRQSSETLAGRLAYLELFPLSSLEVKSQEVQRLWNRGGFPESFLAKSEAESFNWRTHFIKTYLERDIPQLGPRIPSETLRRFWTMLAHNQGQQLNAASLARGLDVSGVTIARYLELMVDLLLVRRLKPWGSNLGRRLIKAPKVYLRDSGLCHALLGIGSLDELLGHPVVGGSFEGFVIENILGTLPELVSSGYYRTSGGAEVDLVLEFSDSELWAIEIKKSSAPKISKGFYSSCEDLNPARKFVVHAGEDTYPLKDGVMAISLYQIQQEILKRCHADGTKQ